MRVTSHVSFFLHAVVISSPCISAASFFTKREGERERERKRRHIRYLCPHKKGRGTLALVRAITAQLFAYTHVRSRTWLVQLSHLGACRRLQRVQQTAQCAATAGTPFSSVARYVAWFAYIPGVVPVSFLLSLLSPSPLLFATANRPITTIRSHLRFVETKE